MAVTLSVNGKKSEIEPGQTLAEILEAAKVRPTISVVFLNKARIDRTALADHTVADGDTVEVVIQLAGGSDV